MLQGRVKYGQIGRAHGAGVGGPEADVRGQYLVGRRDGARFRQTTGPCRRSCPFAYQHHARVVTVGPGGTGLNRSPVYVSRMVDDLEKESLIERRPHKLDRRRKVLHLSAEGRVLVDRMRDRAIELAAAVFKETPDERLQIMSVQSKRIAERLQLATSGRFVA
ncbi:MAG: MarR family transcriptional regulator [Brevundimonas sp.]|uniref:MarR family winged helix-turn-helix transcriptional regulator n=1 Tax=Brevundimonas sp. TaxID=1871086 RepID=UPI003001B09B